MFVTIVLMKTARNAIFLNLIHASNVNLILTYLISNVFQNVQIDSTRSKILWCNLKMDIFVNHAIIIAQLVLQLQLIGNFY